MIHEGVLLCYTKQLEKGKNSPLFPHFTHKIAKTLFFLE